MSPSTLRDTGTTPDYRFSLANERTFLAWLRTGLALTGGGLAVAQFLPPFRVDHLRELIAGVLMALGAACALRAIVHWAACERAMRLGRDLPSSRFPTILAILVFIGAIILIGAVAFGLFSP
ncbi:YidH family protein [Stackebrandtia soli]|uniref:YidH family protein n=1 Tax=Stackebrandtia soli TaxID=1892856 RepID=UPI0039E9F6AC